MAVLLGDKNIGDVVKIEENGVAVNFIVVHKGKPSNLYDSSCDGVWLLREAAKYGGVVFNANNRNDYGNSDITKWLNGEYLNSIDSEIRDTIKQVKIPYKKGTGSGVTAGEMQSGANGLPCKIFLLSGYEVGFTTSDNQYFPIDGTRLSYFLNGNSDDDAKAKRVCNADSGNFALWWLRSVDTHSSEDVWSVNSEGSFYRNDANLAYGARTAFVLPSSLLVNSDGTVSTNTLPTITSDKTGDLGTLASGFTCNYSVDDENAADTLTVTLTLDGVQLDQFTAERNEQYSYTLGGSEWLRITEGEHTFKIIAADGYDTVEETVTFSRSVDGAVISLEAPLEADDVIRVCSLFVKGSLPMDTDLLCEVTNNGNDAEPVWEDCTVKVKSCVPYVFKNKTAENGFAFNFRVTAKRGLSDTGGYITEVSGGFE